MASLKSLTDQELRKKLKEHGIVAPVTASTRDILIKKVNHAIANEKKSSTSNSRARRTQNTSRLHTFSSDEDEDNDSSMYSQGTRTSARVPSRSRAGAAAAANTRKGPSTAASATGDSSYSSKRSSSGSSRSVVSGGDKSRVVGQVSSGHSAGAGRLVHSMTEAGQATGGGAGVRCSSEDSVSVAEDDDCREDLSPYNNHHHHHHKQQQQQQYHHSRSSPGYFSVSPRSGLVPRGNVPPDDYDTGSDSDVGDGEDAVDLSQKMMVGRGAWSNNNSDGISNNNNRGSSNNKSYSRHQYHHQNHTGGDSAAPGWSFNAMDSVSRKRKNRSLLENGHEMGECEHAEGNTSYQSIIDSVVTHATPSTPDQARVANGRHHSEGSMLEQCHGDESTWHYSVPLVLLVLLAVFFGVVGILYVNMHVPLLPTLSSVPVMVRKAVANLSVPFFTSDTNSGVAVPRLEVSSPVSLPGREPSTSTPPSHPKERFPVCSGQLQSDCLSLKEVSLVKPMLGLLDRVLLPELQTWAGQYQCGQASTRHMPIDDLAHLVHSHKSLLTLEECKAGLEALGRLVEWNPHWGLETVRQEQGEVLGLSLAKHTTQILCHITSAIYSFFYLLIGIFTAILTAWLAFSCVRYYRERLKEEERQVCDLVDQIVVMVSARGAGSKGVVMQNIRDSIFPPRERVANETLWDKAVAFIDRYESRVRREVQTVDREDQEVWRWVSSVPPSSSPSTSVAAGTGQEGSNSRPLARVWQGPAFNTQAPHNAPNVSPTSCLKIRNMFDCDVEFGDSWPTRIQDSLLEKCEGVSVVHVAVDRASQEGCVYIKCDSLQDAGRAFRALHGWWYDGNLVTVKFLRDERYHQRFPSALHAHRPLKPSNNQRLSLQHPPANPHGSSPAPTHHLHSPVHS